MKYYNLVIGEEKISFKVPQNWSEVSWNKYTEYIGIVESSVDNSSDTDMYKKIYSVFTGLDESVWDMNLDASVYLNIDNDLSFIGKEPKCERPTDIERDGVYYPITEDFMNMPIGKYRDILNIISESSTGDRVTQLKGIPKMIAVMACDDYESEQELEEISKDIEKMQSDEVNMIAAFFLSKLNLSRNGTSEKQSTQSSVTRKNKQVTVRLLKITASFTRFTIYPTKTLRNMMKSLNRRFRRFIGRSNYRVALMMPKKDMLV